MFLKKTLTYYRANWDWEDESDQPTLQEVLQKIRKKQPAVKDRVYRHGDSKRLMLQRLENRGQLTRGHLVLVEPDSLATIVKKAEVATGEESDIGEQAASEGSDYLNGNLFFVCFHDHLFLSEDQKVKAPRIWDAIFQATETVWPELDWFRCSIEPVANQDVLKTIAKEKVARLEFNDVVTPKAQQEIAHASASTFESIKARVTEWFYNDPETAQLADLARATVKLSINFDGRMPKKFRKRIEDAELAAAGIAYDEDDEVTIVTREGSSFSRGEARYRRIVQVQRRPGNTVDCGATWIELTDFYKELVKNGSIRLEKDTE